MTEQCGLAIKNKYMIINKIDENTISVKKTETTTKTIFYNYDFLVEQRDTIIEDAENYALSRQKEIEEEPESEEEPVEKEAEELEESPEEEAEEELIDESVTDEIEEIEEEKPKKTSKPDGSKKKK